MTRPSVSTTERGIQHALVIFTALLPLVVRPGIERPFSTIKLQLLAIAVVAALVAAAGLRLLGRPRIPVTMDLALVVSGASLALSSATGPWVSLPALALAALGLGWFWTLMSFQPEAGRLLRAVAVSGGAMAAVALLQFVDLDPFQALGWTGEQFQASRMRLFSTLGNPNFVAAFLAGVVPVQFSIAARRWPNHRAQALGAAFMLILSISTLALTGTRSAYLGLGLALAWSVWSRLPSRRRPPAARNPDWRRRAAVGLATALVLGIVALFGSVVRNPRPIGQAIEGRIYIWTIAVDHLPEYVVAGLGPGAFALAYPGWEAAAWRDGRFDETNRQFANAAQDHAHNDYLELMIEQGIAGLVGFVAILVAFFRFAGRRATASGEVAASSAGVAALAGVAVMDFPLHRPAELFLFWTLVAAGFLWDRVTVGGRSGFAASTEVGREER
jgi:hypothetical protein